MNGIVINIDPVIFYLGAFEFRWYSLTMVLAIVAAVLITAHRSQKYGIATEGIYSLAFWVVIGGVVGARLFHVIDHWEHYAGDPLQILQLQQGGLAIWGALGGGGAAAVIYAKVMRIPIGRLVDAVAPGLLVAQIIGRFGCIINGDAYGGITGLPWAFIYIHPGALIPGNLFGVPTHPYPVYEIIWNALSLLAILKLSRHFKQDGLMFLSYLSLYSLGRFVFTFVRQEYITLWGLQQAQVLAIAILVASVAAFIYLSRRTRRGMTAENGV